MARKLPAGAAARRPCRPTRPSTTLHDESGDGVFAELWDTLRAVATDPALIDALEGGQREREVRSDVA